MDQQSLPRPQLPPVPRAMATPDAPAPSPTRGFDYRAVLDGQAPRRPALARSVSEQPRKHCHDTTMARASLPGASELHAGVDREALSVRHTFTFGHLPALVRQFSQLLRAASSADVTFRCHICFDDVDVGETVVLTACAHRFCASCFKAYLELKIAEGNVYPVCFHPVDDGESGLDGEERPRQQRACGVPIDTDQIKTLVDADSVDKLTRFRFDKEHQHVRECPYCSHAQICRGPQEPQCTCESCSKTFCFLHANAHPDVSCADYELRHAESEAVNRAKIQEISKPCPGCGRDVEKNGGCNHMRCIMCNTHFCWLCGETVEDAVTPAHYDSANGGPCSGRQFDGMDAQPQEWWMRLYVTIAIVVCGPPACVLAVAAMPFVLCWKRDRSVADRFESAVTAFTIALQVPLAIVYFTIVGIIQNIVVAVVYVFRTLRNAVCSARARREANPVPVPAPNDLETGAARVQEPTQ